MKIEIYTDGACSGNPGPGGYGIVMLTDKGHYKEFAAGFRKTTNNRMELLSVIAALEKLKAPSEVTIFSDSKYVVDAVEKGWLKKWERKGFKDKKNPDLWKDYLKQAALHKVTFQWVKGHAGNKHNEICDKLAVEASKKENLPADCGYEQSKGNIIF